MMDKKSDQTQFFFAKILPPKQNNLTTHFEYAHLEHILKNTPLKHHQYTTTQGVINIRKHQPHQSTFQTKVPHRSTPPVHIIQQKTESNFVCEGEGERGRERERER